VSELKTLRRGRVQGVTVGTSSSSSSTIRLDDMASGVVYLAGAATAATTLQVWASVSPDDTYLPLQAADGSDVVVSLNTTESRAYVLPSAVGTARFIRLVSDADIGTAATVSVSVKS
jgi:hypothetical protein